MSSAVAPPSTMVTTLTEAERFGRLYTGGKVQVSGDGASLACACGSGINLMSVATGKVLLTVMAEGDDEFTAFALHPSLPELVTSGRSRQLRSWSLDPARGTSEGVRVWKAHKMPVLDLAYDPTGTLVASGASDGVVMVFDVGKGFCTHVFRGHEGVVHTVAFHPDASRLQLYSTAADNTVRVWDLRSRECVATLRTHVGLPTCLAFSADGGTLLTGGRDQLVGVWRLRDFSLLTSIAVMEAVEGLVVLPAAADADADDAPGRTPPLVFATAGDAGLLRCWDAASGRCVRKQASPHRREAFSALSHLARCGDALLAVSTDHNFLFHSASSLQPTRCIVGNNDEITDLRCVRTAPAGEAAAAAGADAAEAQCAQLAVATNSEQVRLFGTADMACRLLCGHTDVVLALDVSADHEHVASASKDCTARVWSARTGECVAVCEGHVEAVGAVVFTRRGGMLISGSKDKTMKLWKLGELGGAGSRPRAISSKLAHAKEVNALAVAPNDRLAVSASQDRTLKVWSLGEGGMSEAATLKGHKRAVWCAAFSPVDKVAASGSGDMTLKLWSVRDFSCIRTFSGHTSSVLKVHFVSRGLQLLTSGSDGLVKLWTVKTAECGATLDAHDNKVWALDVCETADGRLEAWSGSADSVVVRWRDCTLEAQQGEAAEQALQLQQEQELSIAVHARQFDAAIELALKLRRPRALRQVIEQLVPTEHGEATLRRAVAALDDDEMLHCLQCARDWNVSASHSLVAHRLLHAILKAHPASRLAGLPQFKSTLEALIPYSERHFERLDRLAQGAQCVGYRRSASRVLLPSSLASAAPAEAAEADGSELPQAEPAEDMVVEDGADDGADDGPAGEAAEAAPAADPSSPQASGVATRTRAGKAKSGTASASKRPRRSK